MVRYRQGLERRGRGLARLVDIGAEMYAMGATISRARALARTELGGMKPTDLADAFCRKARRKIAQLFRELHGNGDDSRAHGLAQQVLANQHTWLEQGVLHPEDFAGKDGGREQGASAPESRETVES